MDPETDPPEQRPEFVAAVDYETGVIPLARPGVVVWLDDDAPDDDELSRATAKRSHAVHGTDAPEHLRAVS